MTTSKKFKLGQIFATNGVHQMMKEDSKFGQFVYESFTRHCNGDWGDLCEEDKTMNEAALRNGYDRLFSRYNYKDDISIYIITEWDRSTTTILFPDEY